MVILDFKEEGFYNQCGIIKGADESSSNLPDLSLCYRIWQKAGIFMTCHKASYRTFTFSICIVSLYVFAQNLLSHFISVKF